MKKIIVLISACLMLITGLSGCSGSKAKEVSGPDINISFSDSKVVINDKEMIDQGDTLLCKVYYTRIFDGRVACIEEQLCRKYYYNKETKEGWKYYDGIREECTGGTCKIKATNKNVTANGDSKGNIKIAFTIDDDGYLNIESLEGKAQSNKVTLSDSEYYKNIHSQSERYENGRRIKNTSCQYDYYYEFPLHYSGSYGAKGKATATFFVTPDEFWIEIFVPNSGWEKYNLSGVS